MLSSFNCHSILRSVLNVDNIEALLGFQKTEKNGVRMFPKNGAVNTELKSNGQNINSLVRETGLRHRGK